MKDIDKNILIQALDQLPVGTALVDARREHWPVVYMNSDLDLKSFCGERGGIVCTSSNARKVFDWSYARGQ